jgi:heme-degrading monooxygenase HmoA
MILELVKLNVKDGSEEEFEIAIEAALWLFRNAEGCHGMEVLRSIEHPRVYYCLVKWATVAHHTEKFQKSPAYRKLFELIGETIERDVDATHCEYVVTESYASWSYC